MCVLLSESSAFYDLVYQLQDQINRKLCTISQMIRYIFYLLKHIPQL